MISMESLAHPCFLQPNDPNSLVWRYMDLAKLISLIVNQSLHFVRLDQLDDKYEGSAPLALAPDLLAESQLATLVDMARCTYVSCWCMSPHESDALWRIYTGELGVAIQSRYRLLLEALEPHDFVGLISYIDYDRDILDRDNPLRFVMHKRRQFEFEREVRAVVHGFDDIRVVDGRRVTTCRTGVSRKIHPSDMIDNIIVSPYAPEWYFECVQQVVRRLNSPIPVTWSNMRRRPTANQDFWDDSIVQQINDAIDMRWNLRSRNGNSHQVKNT